MIRIVNPYKTLILWVVNPYHAVFRRQFRKSGQFFGVDSKNLRIIYNVNILEVVIFICYIKLMPDYEDKLDPYYANKLLKKIRVGRGKLKTNMAGDLEIDMDRYKKLESKEDIFNVCEIWRFAESLGMQVDSVMGINNLPPLKLEEKRVVVERYLESAHSIDVSFGTPELLLYLIDVGFYHKYNEYLMGLQYFKSGLPEQSPVFYFSRDITAGSFHDDEYSYIEYPDEVALSDREFELIDDVMEFCKNKTEEELLEYVKKDVPVLAGENGDEINYEMVFYRPPKHDDDNEFDMYRLLNSEEDIK